MFSLCGGWVLSGQGVMANTWEVLLVGTPAMPACFTAWPSGLLTWLKPVQLPFMLRMLNLRSPFWSTRRVWLLPLGIPVMATLVAEMLRAPHPL